MSKNIQIRAKTDSGYPYIYPASDAAHIERNNKIISYLEGDNLLEITQDTANKYLVPDGSQWFRNADETLLDSSSRMCVKDNFVCVITPKLVDSVYTLYCTISHNGGITWGSTQFTPNAGNYIIEIIGIECTLKNQIEYEVTIVGKRYLSDNKVFTYQLYIPHNSFSISSGRELDVLTT